jgi:predicted nucleic acid-binding protein
MKFFFDASALVPLLNQTSPHHAETQRHWLQCDQRATSCHALAESYRTLTTLKNPLKPEAARVALEELKSKVELVSGTPEVYEEAIRRMVKGGHAGAMIYDALHCVAAGVCKADKIVTRNKAHFDLFAQGIAVEAI